LGGEGAALKTLSAICSLSSLRAYSRCDVKREK
jgi:hypothetical protein